MIDRLVLGTIGHLMPDTSDDFAEALRALELPADIAVARRIGNGLYVIEVAGAAIREQRKVK